MIKRILLTAAAAAFIGTVQAQDQKPAASGPDPKVFQEIYACLAPGLAPGWAKAWVAVTELDRTDDGKSRNYEGLFRYSLKLSDDEGEELSPCDTAFVIKNMGDMNEFLKPEQRNWVSMILTYTSDGRYEMKYDYAPPKPRAKPKPGAKPGAKPAAKPAAAPKPAPAKTDDTKGSGFKLQ
jgi:hypothetical protein